MRFETQSVYHIICPDGKSLSFSWNSRGKLTQLTAIEDGTVTSFAISYDGMNRINQYIKSVGGIQSETWNFFYGPTGIDKVTRTEGGIQNLSIDYTTDKNGRILSAAYNETGGFNGELFYTFDNFGNTSTLTDTQGNIVVGYLYDLNNGVIKSEYNPYEIKNPFSSEGKERSVIFPVDLFTNIILDLMGNDYIVSNSWGKAADGGATNGEDEYELVQMGYGLYYMEIGDHVFWATGGLAIFCEDFKKNGNKFNKQIRDYFNGKGKTDSEIRNLEGIVGDCCDCKGGYVAKYLQGRWGDPFHGKEGEIIGCQPTGGEGGGKTKIGPFGYLSAIFNAIWILEGW